MVAAQELAQAVGAREACEALAVARSSFYRHAQPKPEPSPRPKPSRALAVEERAAVLDLLHQPRFVDQAPAEVYATLLDEGTYRCSTRTMYRILHDSKEVRERRNIARHPNYKKPELLATGPNQVWSWDITKLRTFTKGAFFALYVVLDIFSRYVVGWLLSHHESEANARLLLKQSFLNQNVSANQLTVHADRGAPMKAKNVAQLLVDLAVTKTHSRPHVSNDNPFSESHFKILKYWSEFPERFGSLEEARDFLVQFFLWYNERHHHSGIGFLTPAQLHYGQAHRVLARRQLVLDAAHAAHPERFVRKHPEPPPIPTEVWINPPRTDPPTKIVHTARNTTDTVDHHDAIESTSDRNYLPNPRRIDPPK